MTHPPHNIESTLRAWTEVCRTSEGRYEYWRRFGDYLFTNPAREIPPELFSPPPAALRPRTSRRQRKPDASVPGGLKTAAQAAAKLGCSIKTLNGHVANWRFEICRDRSRHEAPASVLHRRRS
jgi:hypothetical protein